MDTMTGNVAASLFGAFDVFSKAMTGAARKPTDRGLSPLLRRAADAALAATDRADLVEALDEILVNDQLFAEPSEPTWGANWKQEFAGKLESWADHRLDLPSLRQVLGRTATAKCEQGHAALVGLMRFGAAILTADFQALGIEIPKFSSKKTAPSSRSGIFYDLKVPAPLRRVTTAFMRSFVAGLVIARAEEHGELLQPWLAMCLAEVFAEGFLEPHELVQSLGRNPAIFDDLKAMKASQDAVEHLIKGWWSSAGLGALQSGDWDETG